MLNEVVAFKINRYNVAFKKNADIIVLTKEHYDKVDKNLIKDFEVVIESNIKSPIVFKK